MRNPLGSAIQMKAIISTIMPLLVFAGCVSDPMIQRAELVAARHQLAGYATFQRLMRAGNVTYPTLDSARALPSVTFLREIASPFNRTRFFHFVETWMEPNSHDVVCCFHDTLTMLPVDTSQWQYLDDSILYFLNRRIADESHFTAAKVIEFFRFYNDLRDPGFGFQVTLDSWRDIVWEEGTQIPAEIERLIHEPRVQQVGERFVATGYVWDKGSTELRKVVLTFENRSISMKATVVGRFGASHLII